MKRFSIVLATLSVIAMAKAQNVGIGTVLPHPSAALELNSNSQGLLVPRLTKTEKSAIAAPATGLMVYQTGPDSSGFHYYNGTAWVWINPQTASGGGSFPPTGIVLSETANNSALSGAGFSYSGLLRLPGATLEQTGPAGANTWLSTNAVSGPPPATGHQALYSDSSFYVWGGNMGFNNPGIGVYRYNPITDRWTNLNPSGTTSSTGPAYGSASVKAGNKWVHWGGYTYPGGTGLPAVVYDFGTNAITYSSSAPFSVGLAGVASVGIGNKAYFWGGYYLTNFSIRVNLGFVYDVATNTWQSMSTSEAPQERAFAGMVHTGTKLIVWGGNTANGNTNTGGVYTIATNSWEPMGIGNAPAATIDPIMVWRSPFLYVISGNMAKRYDPTTYQWTNLATAPTVFSGNKFTYDDNGKIYIWGGTRVYNSPSPTANGYVYDLDSNTFTALPATGAPEARGDHTLTFGNNMLLVWGGTSSNTSSSPTVAQSFNSGGRYVLAPTTVTNAAPAALWHLFKKQ